MAAESLALRTLEEQITCPVCLEDYKDPRVLVCLHVYCTGCLEKLLLRSSQAGQAGSLTCPNCRKVTQIPPNGVAGLEKAFYINRLFDIRKSLTKTVADPETSNPKVIPPPEEATATGGSGVVVPSEDPKVTCPEHRKNEQTLFCETCRKVICLECTIQVHNGHTYHLLKDVAEKEKALVRPMVDALNAPIEALRKGLEEAERRKMDVVDLKASIEGNVHGVIKELHDMLEERESDIISQLDHVTKVKLKELTLEVNEKETLQAKMCSCSRNAREALANENTIEFMTKRAGLERDLHQALKEYEWQPNAANVCTQADMVLDLPQDYKQRWTNFGEIMTPGSLDPQMCVAKGKGLEMPHIGETAVIYLSVNNRQGGPFMKPLPRLECTVVLEGTDEFKDCEVGNQEMNTYEVSYVPMERGVYQIHIKVAGVHIQGSPFSVRATLPVEKLGTSIAVLDDAAQPWGMAINEEGEKVVVSECNGHVISVFSPTGTRIRSFGSKGSGRSNLKHPRGVAMDKSGHIFVVDSGNHRVQKFTSEGEFLACAGTKGRGRNQFTEPRGIAFNPVNNQLYVADVNRIQILTSDLDFYKSFGSKGNGNGQFLTTFGVACNSMGHVYVADCGNRNIQIFSAEGKFLSTFANGSSAKNLSITLWGEKPPLIAPVAIAIDNSGHVYVSDDAGNRVLVFSSDGKCLKSFGMEGFATGSFKNPRSIAVTQLGMVYVCDYHNNRVQVF